jgi:hypothetical protein
MTSILSLFQFRAPVPPKRCDLSPMRRIGELTFSPGLNQGVKPSAGPALIAKDKVW